jgi:kynureninase
MPPTTFTNTLQFARQLDAQDELRSYRERFHLPVQENGDPFLYFTGNSLGCQPKTTREYVMTELDDWEKLGVEGHFHARNPWMPYHEFLTDSVSRLVGANKGEAVVMGSLTNNLHLLMVSFYRPTPERYKILMEDDAFPSDHYAMDSQAKFHGYDPKDAVIKMKPREGEHTVRTEDILDLIEREGESISTIMFGGMNYYTGQLFEMEKITKAGHAKGCKVGFDLAHAVGNVPLKLHDWGVDFAAWCHYKYCNSGPGSVAGLFVHERHATDTEMPKFAGWWGHDKERRFLMESEFHPIPGAESWQLSNAPILSMAALRASLAIFDEVGMEALRAKSQKLTAYLEYLLADVYEQVPIQVITPKDPNLRGAQLSLLTLKDGKELFNKLMAHGVITDWREPNVIRMAPVPLYNSFEDVWKFVQLLIS